MLGLRHRLERVGDLRGFERDRRQRLERAVREQVEHLTIDLRQRRWIVAVHARHIEHKERAVAPQRPQTQRTVAVDVSFADFNEPAVRRHDGDAERDGFARKRVQNDVDSAPVCDLSHVFSEGERTGIEDVRNTELLQVGALLAAACGADDVGAEEARDLDGGKTHAAGSQVDEHGFAFAHARQVLEPVVGGRERRRNGRCFDECHFARQAMGGMRRHAHLTSEHALGGRHDAVADAPALYACAKLGDDAAALKAERAPWRSALGVGGQQPGRRHDVAEIQAARFHGDLDLAFGRRDGRCFDEAQVVEVACRAHAEAIVPYTFGVVGRGGARRQDCFDRRAQARHEPLLATQREFRFLGLAEQQRRQRRRFCAIDAEIKVDNAALVVRVFGQNRACESGQRRADQSFRQSFAIFRGVGCFADRMDALGQDPKARFYFAVLRQRLHQVQRGNRRSTFARGERRGIEGGLAGWQTPAEHDAGDPFATCDLVKKTREVVGL